MLYIYNAPIISVARMDKFTRGMILAKSLKNQRDTLALVHRAIKAGALDCAKHYLAMWKKERQAFKIAKEWQKL